MDAIAPDVACIDLRERGQPERMAGYFIGAPRPALIESGASRSVPHWLEFLEKRDIPRDEIAYLIVTHVHLDHAGGAGTLLKHLPHARLVVHPSGARHLVDPTRLVQSARAVFGQQLEAYWGLPEPVDSARIEAPDENARLDLGDGHKLRFLPAYGHARHQYMILDEGTGALWAGDELGIRYPRLRCHPDYVLPTTAPNQFDPEAMIRSVELVRSLGPEAVLPSHFGRLRMDLEQLAERLRQQIHAFSTAGRSAAADGLPPTAAAVEARLRTHIRADLEDYEVEWSDEVEALLDLDLR
ncbi:MAG TPA: MBL fold metallo-hydrolase, partial [Bacillota bacterium]